MNLAKLANAIGTRLSTMTFAERFRFLASWYGGLPYSGGEENPVSGADCSGTVCGPLWLMGYNIRCTADSLYRNVFLDEVSNHESHDDVMAVFCLTQVNREHFGRVVPAGYATHVAPVIGRYVVMNAFDPIEPMTTAYVHHWYSARDFDVEWRKLNIDALKQHSSDRDLVFGVDPILQKIRPA